MGISFAPKKPGVAPAPAAKKAAPAAPPSKPTPVAAAAKPAAPGLKFIKRGNEAKAVMASEEKKAEMRKDQVQRFFLPKDKTTEITFLDGNLLDGILDIPFYHEHNLYLNGNWRNWFICTQDEEPCPICEGGNSPAYVGVMSVIDHGQYTDKNGVLRKDELKLFVAKRDTIKDLQNKALKRGGLRGCRFVVTRIGDKSPSVGSGFEFEDKLTEGQIIATYGPSAPGSQKVDRSKPINYDKMLGAMYSPASELRKMGFGTANAPVGAGDTGGGEGSGAGYDF